MANWILRNQESGEELELHSQFFFKNRYNWQQLAQSELQRTLSGGFVIQRSLKLNGREITLDGTNTHTSREDLTKLQNWASQNLKFTLASPSGEVFNVIFAYPAIEIIKEREIKDEDKTNEDKFRISLFFISC